MTASGAPSNMEGSTMATMVVRFGTHFSIKLGEWLASLILVSLAVLFFGSPGLFSTSPGYFAVMGQFGPETAWGLAFLLIGGIRLAALYVNGRKRITPYIRMMLAFIACFVWFQIVMSLFVSGVPGLGWAVFPWLLALDMYNVFRSAADARLVYDNKRAIDDGSNKTI
ncbi:hypothetical protein [Sphingomonas phage Birtae]|nr:hypothetical protein [Sphingomonas phage Birtae]